MAIKEIVTNLEILQTKSKIANPNEVSEVIRDLIDTAEAHKERCVGLSAIQIGVPLKVCVVWNGEQFVPFVDPVITKKFGKKYEAEEGCMSLDGTRKVERFECIELFRRSGNRMVKERYRDFMAEIIQHELDHFEGKLI